MEGTYADRNADLQHDAYYWFHSMEEILGSLLRAGLTLKKFEERDYWPWDCFPDFRERAPGEYVLKEFDFSLPYLFSLTMEG